MCVWHRRGSWTGLQFRRAPRVQASWLNFLHFHENGLSARSRVYGRYFTESCFKNYGQYSSGLARYLILKDLTLTPKHSCCLTITHNQMHFTFYVSLLYLGVPLVLGIQCRPKTCLSQTSFFTTIQARGLWKFCPHYGRTPPLYSTVVNKINKMRTVLRGSPQFLLQIQLWLLLMCLFHSNEVGNSQRMEREGFERSLHFLESKGLTIGVIVTDRHPSIRKYIKKQWPSIRHLYDTWHVRKCIFVFINCNCNMTMTCNIKGYSRLSLTH